MGKDVVGTIEKVSTVEEAFKDLLQSLSVYGIKTVFYGVCVRRSQDGVSIWGYFGNYPEKFKLKYIDENWIHFDPTLRAFMSSSDMRPVLWNYPDETERKLALTKEQLETEELAWECGLLNGATIPLRVDRKTSQPLAAAGICASSDLDRNAWNKIWAANRWKIENLLDRFHDHVIGLDTFERQLFVRRDYRAFFDEMISVLKSAPLLDDVDRTLETVSADLDNTPPDKRMERLREIYEYGRTHIHEAYGGVPKDKKRNPLPKKRERYADRANKSEMPGDFLRRVYPEIKAKVLVSHLRERDAKLAAAFYGRDPEGMYDYLMTESQYNELVVDSDPDVKRQAWRVIRRSQRKKK